jgi:hypothetical protein
MFNTHFYVFSLTCLVVIVFRIAMQGLKLLVGAYMIMHTITDKTVIESSVASFNTVQDRYNAGVDEIYAQSVEDSILLFNVNQSKDSGLFKLAAFDRFPPVQLPKL